MASVLVKPLLDVAAVKLLGNKGSTLHQSGGVVFQLPVIRFPRKLISGRTGSGLQITWLRFVVIIGEFDEEDEDDEDDVKL